MSILNAGSANAKRVIPECDERRLLNTGCAKRNANIRIR